MSVPRVVVEFPIEGETTAHVEYVQTPDDAWRLQAEMCRRKTLDEIADAVITLFDELGARAREPS